MRRLDAFYSSMVVLLLISACSRTALENSQTDRVDPGSKESVVAGDPPLDGSASAASAQPDTKSSDAEVVLANALTEAKVKDKNVFIHLGAPW
ncbi:MAG: hypothetical protein P8N76_23100 [Pirellulaceae bacterium]|nr:hypothetical protein [Pirellulaceae bacterium]